MLKLAIVALFFFFLFYNERASASKYVNITDFTYHASVRRSGRHVCSGALVHDSWVITAASCVCDSSVAGLSALLGSSELRGGGPVGREARVHRVAKVVVPRTFDRALLTNNLALLRLSRGAGELPIFLPSSADYHLKDGSLLVVSGWRRAPAGKEPEFESQLSAAGAPLVNQRACVRSMPGHKAVSGRKMLCAGYTYPNASETCQGDVGAPLANHDVLVGILSSGDECLSSARPAVYTKVSSFLPWILKVIELDRAAGRDLELD